MSAQEDPTRPPGEPHPARVEGHPTQEREGVPGFWGFFR
jgi:hypothetical protein